MDCPICGAEGTVELARAIENFRWKDKWLPVEYDKFCCTDCNVEWIEGDDPFAKARAKYEEGT